MFSLPCTATRSPVRWGSEPWAPEAKVRLRVLAASSTSLKVLYGEFSPVTTMMGADPSTPTGRKPSMGRNGRFLNMPSYMTCCDVLASSV
ncbi:Uncharacterised protein [Bordetella pertussis]|nr:Uncharacterised protein [Bordetella pertussis]